MAAATTTTTTTVTSSLDRSKEFQKCCAIAMGFEWVDHENNDDDVERYGNGRNEGGGGMFEDNNNGTTSHDDFDGTHGAQGIHQIINLLVDDDDDDGGEKDDEADNEDRAGSNINSNYDTNLWMENAKRISHDLTKTSVWIQSKALKYVGLDMQDDEASLIQSTITTFAASTASELETLREMNNNLHNQRNNTNSNNTNTNLINHRAGIVQILLMKLQDEITTPFSKLQKQRTRIAVKIWQHPLQCRLYHHHHRQHKKNKRNQLGAAGAAGGAASNSPGRSKMEELLFDDEDDYDDDGYNEKDQKFYPKQQVHDEGTTSVNFIQKYAQQRQQQQEQEGMQLVPPQPPDFVQRLAKRQRLLQQQRQQQRAAKKKEKNFDDNDDDSVSEGFDFGGRSDYDQTTGTATKEDFQQPHTIQPPQQQHQHQQPMVLPYQEQLATDLEEETMQLATEMIATSDLDSVQKMEEKMVQITTLIGQFSNLVQEQQEQIVSVHESAIETKENIEKGQENLVDATERTKQSKHYKAMVISAMGFILLFFHILRN